MQLDDSPQAMKSVLESQKSKQRRGSGSINQSFVVEKHGLDDEFYQAFGNQMGPSPLRKRAEPVLDVSRKRAEMRQLKGAAEAL